jgi:hypothetical protein
LEASSPNFVTERRSGECTRIDVFIAYASRVVVFKNPTKGAIVKRTIVRLILVASILLALSATTAMADGGGPIPLCYPDKPCK